MSNPMNIDPSEYSRKIRSLGDFRREKDRLEYEAKKKIILSNPRHIDEDISLRDIGILRLQILYYPSFEPGFLWDIREQYGKDDQPYSVYENSLTTMKTISPGYRKLDVDLKFITDLIENVNLTNVSLRLDSSHRYPLDGTLYGLHVYNSLQRRIKLTWWEDAPADLAVLDKMTKSIVKQFLSIDDKLNIT
jgi:hypothetical protein